MDILNPAALKSLIAKQGGWCVSLYMPTHRAGREQQQDPIRLRNLLAAAEAKLLANGLRMPEIQRLLRPAHDLLWSKVVWRQPGDGLAIFLTDDFHKIYRLPVECTELLSTGTSFHFKPLFPCLRRGMKFYVLAVSLNRVRLFEGNADKIREIQLDFPTSMEEVLSADDPEKFLNLHSGSISMGKARAGSAIFHGHSPADDEKKDILRFFQSVNKGLNELLEEENIPLVLAGVDYLLPIFREASSHQNLLEDAIGGNPDRKSLRELHQKAWEIIRPLFEESQKHAWDRFEQLNGQNSNLVTSDLETALKAAVAGQVETIFVPLESQKWGQYDSGNHTVTVNREPAVEDEDLFDVAAIRTLLNSGQVFAVPAEEVPGGGEVAAILRYAV